MSPSLFAANYELKHIASEEAFFETPPVFTEDVTVFRDGISHIDAAYGGSDYRAFTMGFPFECITEAEKREIIMRGIMNFLIK